MLSSFPFLDYSLLEVSALCSVLDWFSFCLFCFLFLWVGCLSGFPYFIPYSTAHSQVTSLERGWVLEVNVLVLLFLRNTFILLDSVARWKILGAEKFCLESNNAPPLSCSISVLMRCLLPVLFSLIGGLPGVLYFGNK